MDFQIGATQGFVVFCDFLRIVQDDIQLGAGGNDFIGIDKLATVGTDKGTRLALDGFLDLVADTLNSGGIATLQSLLGFFFAARRQHQGDKRQSQQFLVHK